MNSLVILCRHGNTFEKGERVYMVGAREDLPLTSVGIDQGRAIGDAINASGLVPRAIVSGPLKRTRMFAEEVRMATGVVGDVLLDSRLTEFDYGAWSGLSNEEIVARSGAEALRRWQEESVRPQMIEFSPSEAVAHAEALDVLRELEAREGCAVIVTSNGRLRAFGRAFTGISGAFKVRTGHACVIIRDTSEWRTIGWDLSPEELRKELRAAR